MSKLKIFAVSGKAQHGKDTFSEILAEDLTNRGFRVIIAHYADLLKYICKTFFKWDGKKDEEGRKLLQYVGTDVVRKKCPDLWVDFIITMIDFFGENWDYVIISDTRFPNELNKLKEYFDNVEHIRVVRPNFKSSLTEEQLNHPSETALDNVVPDYVFENEGTLDELRSKIEDWRFE